MNDVYLIVSDLHLTDVEDNEDGWRKYKSSKYVIDEDFATLLEDFSRRHPDQQKILILNGDIFDFDLVTALPEDPPWKIHRVERKIGLFPSEDKSVWKLRYILKDHPLFLEALAGFVANGNRIIYIMGNHDREFYFKKVQEAFKNAIQEHSESPIDTNNIEFYDWFYYQPGKIYVEHGQQYDYYSTFKNLLCPTIPFKGEEIIALPMGNISSRFLMSKIGYFNPHASDFVLSAPGYVMHWLKYYAFTRRSLIFNWIYGSLQTMVFLRRVARIMKKNPRNCDDRLCEVARRTGIEEQILRELMKEESPPVEDRFFRVMREFWMDRLIFFILFIITTVTLALVPIPLWIKLMVPLTALPLLFFLYERVIHDIDIFVVDHEIPKKAKKIAEKLDVKFVIFGHTHKPRIISLDNGLTFVDTGSWAPIYDENGKKVDGYNNFFELKFQKGEYSYMFGSWDLKNIRLIPVRNEEDFEILRKFVGQKNYDILDEEGKISFLAILGNTTIGAAILEKVEENKLKLDSLMVDAWIGMQNIDKYLMERIREILDRSGYYFVGPDSSSVSDQTALA